MKEYKKKENFKPMKPLTLTVDKNVVDSYGDNGLQAYLKDNGIMFSKFISFILENPKLVELLVDCMPMNDTYRTKAWLKEQGREDCIKPKKSIASENEELNKLLENIRNMNK